MTTCARAVAACCTSRPPRTRACPSQRGCAPTSSPNTWGTIPQVPCTGAASVPPTLALQQACRPSLALRANTQVPGRAAGTATIRFQASPVDPLSFFDVRAAAQARVCVRPSSVKHGFL